MRTAILRGDLPALLGLIAPALWLATEDAWLLPRLILCLAVVGGWQLLFARRLGQPLDIYGLVTAGLIALLVPASAPFWQLALGISFGVVLGEAIFGGRGRNFVQPVVLTLAFMAFSFADQPWRDGPELPLLLAIPALVLLIGAGQARLPVILGTGLGIAGFGWLIGAGQVETMLVTGSLILAAAYLTADPVASGATTAGRWLYGLLAGALAVLFATTGPAFGALVFATLLAQIFAPLIDHLVIAAHIRRMARRERRLRHG